MCDLRQEARLGGPWASLQAESQVPKAGREGHQSSGGRYRHGPQLGGATARVPRLGGLRLGGHGYGGPWLRGAMARVATARGPRLGGPQLRGPQLGGHG